MFDFFQLFFLETAMRKCTWNIITRKKLRNLLKTSFKFYVLKFEPIYDICLLILVKICLRCNDARLF